MTNSYELVYNWFNLIREKYSIDTTVFVIMPNHVHASIHLNASNNLNKVVSNGNRFMAYAVVKRLNSKGRTDVLVKLNESCSEYDEKNGSLHKVF